MARARAPRPAWLPLPSKRRLDRAVATLDETCARVVRSRRARGIEPDASDLLALLLRSADADADGQGGLTDREVRDEIVTLVIAGHETVASSLGWTLQLLAEHPAVQDRLHAELDAGAGRARAGLVRRPGAALHPSGRRRGPAALPARLGAHPARRRGRRGGRGRRARRAVS